MINDKSIEDFLFEYILLLSAGSNTRQEFEKYKEYLNFANIENINSVIDRFIKTQNDFDLIEVTVSKFIRACEKGLERNNHYVTKNPYLALLLEENFRLEKHRANTSKIYKDFALGYQKAKNNNNTIPLTLKNMILEFNEIRPHYLKLQNSLFPTLEQYLSNMNCLKLMWHIQDGVLNDLKALLKVVEISPFDFKEFNKLYGDMYFKIGNLIYRERNILFPLVESKIKGEELYKLFKDVEVLKTSFNVNLSDFYGGKNMSEIINNSQKRKEELNSIIKALNESGGSISVQKEIKKDFKKLLDTLSAEEIAEAEQALIAEGVAVEEVQKLCELHVDTFHEALKSASKRIQNGNEKISGHPIANYRAENKELKSQIVKFKKSFKKLKRTKDFTDFDKTLSNLSLIDIHYTRKENQLFPYLENVGFTGPSKVMWAKHDEIRALFKKIKSASIDKNIQECISKSKALIPQLKRMIFMEEKILFPTALRKLPESAWIEIRRGEAEIGYAWIKPGNLWAPEVVYERNEKPSNFTTNIENELINLSVGKLSISQINLMLTNLPIDITYVDENDKVRYFSQGTERIFPRSEGIIGRDVQNCHPPKSVHIVEKILDDFKAGKREVAEFWIQMNNAFIHIRYFPLFENNIYKGVIEVSQEISRIRALEGEKRLLDEA